MATRKKKVTITARRLLNMLQGERSAYEKLSLAYRIVHSLDKSRGCYHVHKNWRREVFRLLQVGEAHHGD